MEVTSILRYFCRGWWKAAKNLYNIGCKLFMHYKGKSFMMT